MCSASGCGVSLKAPAKLNLHLGIHPGRDARGYHRADSVMIALDLADCVRIRQADSLSVSMSEDCGTCQEHNTAFRAARLLCEAFDKPKGYEIYIDKRIPAQSGLGGASSDAASVLLGLCRIWGQDPLDDRVVAVAQNIGADVPFFLTLVPAWFGGAGDVLRERFSHMPGVDVVLVRPNVGVSTVEAYRAFDEDPTIPVDPSGMCEALRVGDARNVARHLYNNLEPAANRLVPLTREVREWLAAQPGVWAAQLTGSGSCVFALCESRAVAQCIAQDAQEAKKWWSCATKTVGDEHRFC